jgi:hypothetical protein
VREEEEEGLRKKRSRSREPAAVVDKLVVCNMP